MKDLPENYRIVRIVQAQLATLVKADVSGLIETQRDPVVESMAITASVDGVKPAAWKIDLIEGHDLEYLWGFEISWNAHDWNMIVLVCF